MNINRASLFPGLDGFARSLGIQLQIPLNRNMLLMLMGGIPAAPKDKNESGD
jgi:hypothetical protein